MVSGQFRSTIFAVALMAGLVTSSLVAQQRTWKDTSGKFSVQAELVEVTDESVVLKRTDNGKQISVPLGRLSQADREFLANMESGDSDAADSPVKVTGQMIWSEALYGDGDEPTRTLQLEIVATGQPAADALEFGMLQVDKIQTDQGTELKQKEDEFSFVDITTEYKKVDRDDQFMAKHPAGGVRVALDLDEPDGAVNQIVNARGKFKIRTGGDRSSFKIEQAPSLAGDPLDLKEFAELGITAEIKVEDQDLRLELDGNHAAISHLEVLSPAGKEYSSLNGGGEGGGGTLHQYFYSFENEVPDDAVFIVHVVQNTVEMEIPFELANLRIPAKPDH